MNLNSFASERPLIGTLFELAWAWEYHKPVVAVVDKGNHLMREHPFVKATVSHYCETVEEACRFIVEQAL